MNTSVPIVRAIIREALRKPGNSGTVAFARVFNDVDDGGADIDFLSIFHFIKNSFYFSTIIRLSLFCESQDLSHA
jgi:hypothetical protein